MLLNLISLPNFAVVIGFFLYNLAEENRKYKKKQISVSKFNE